jgi:hypothetical protein
MCSITCILELSTDSCATHDLLHIPNFEIKIDGECWVFHMLSRIWDFFTSILELHALHGGGKVC